MKILMVFVCLTITWVKAQNGRGPQHLDHTGHGWDIRLAVPGEPGTDYPTLNAIPRTSFSCAGREPGYYADLETNCQVFRVCTVGSTYGFQSFLCPNGTLFNQAVFVCDWWMNVNCQNSQQFVSNNNERFENLRLGPQLMKDIKKMLTHPMRNPLDKNAMKSNLIVMQDYKPPFGQLFPNGALLAGPERPPNNVYIPAKLINQNVQNNPNDISFSASTPEPRLLIGQFMNNLPSQTNLELFQKQRQSSQNIQNGRIHTTQPEKFLSNGHGGRYVQTDVTKYNANLQLPNPTQSIKYFQTNASVLENSTPDNPEIHREGLNKPRSQYTEARKLTKINNVKQNNINVHQTNPHNNKDYSVNQRQEIPPISNFPQFSKHISNTSGKELKQNLVSNIENVLTTAATKSTTYTIRPLLSSKTMKLKPRIRVKTWIVKPTKMARLIINPTPYTYPKPTQTSNDKLIKTTPYMYDTTTTSSRENLSFETETESEEPYIYTKPTSLPKQVSTSITESTSLFIVPTTSAIRSTVSARLSLPPTKSPLIDSRVYLSSPTLMTNNRYYLPPSRNSDQLSRQYLSPHEQPAYYQNAQLRATPTMPSPTNALFTLNYQKPTAITKQTGTSSTFNNLTFTDVLTREKLDLTVSDIVKDTNNILKTATPPHYRSEFNSVDYTEDDYLATITTTESGEKLTTKSPLKSTASLKSSRLTAIPSPSLIPPKETFVSQNTNRLSNLPYFKESFLPNTIERTVSIKITIPERIAAYLFKNNSESDYDKLEILNTGSSNYLVLGNNLLTKNNGFNFIPIAQLNGQKSSNISNSQALVYSFLADSINAAREYKNIATRDATTSTSTPAISQLQNMNYEDLSQITNKISQLTSSQYSRNNANNMNSRAEIISTQITNTIPTDQFRYTEEQNQPRQMQSSQYSILPSQQTQQQYSSPFKTVDDTETNRNIQNQVYSGQLYHWSVPDVTNKIYNKPISAEFQSSQKNTEFVQQNDNLINVQNNFPTLQNSNFEIVKAKTIPFNTAKLQLEPPSAPTPFNSQESVNNLLNVENGISAHLQDKIVGTISHPLHVNKLVTFKKDNSYYLYTQLEDNAVEQSPSILQSNKVEQNSKLIHDNNAQDLIAFQQVPSVNYELEDENEKEKILSTFRIDEFGAPRDIIKNSAVIVNKQLDDSFKIDFSVEPQARNQMAQFKINALYNGPSSYSAPQSSVGSLEARQISQNNFNSRLEDFDSNNRDGYPKERPTREFIF